MSKLVQVVMPYLSGLPNDEAVNNLVFASDDVAAIIVDVSAFYNSSHFSGTGSIASHLSRVIDRGVGKCQMKFYDITGKLDGSPHGSPVFVENFTLSAWNPAGTTPLPEEVAIVMSTRGDFTGLSESAGPKKGGTRPRARHRGRIFIGPLNDTTITRDVTSGRSMVQPSCINNIVESARFLKNATHGWSVWSRKNAALVPVIGGWVDDTFDTQRRRGPRPTSRVLI